MRGDVIERGVAIGFRQNRRLRRLWHRLYDRWRNGGYSSYRFGRSFFDRTRCNSAGSGRGNGVTLASLTGLTIGLTIALATAAGFAVSSFAMVSGTATGRGESDIKDAVRAHFSAKAVSVFRALPGSGMTSAKLAGPIGAGRINAWIARDRPVDDPGRAQRGGHAQNADGHNCRSRHHHIGGGKTRDAAACTGRYNATVEKPTPYITAVALAIVYATNTRLLTRSPKYRRRALIGAGAATSLQCDKPG